uniref:Uncharacterized protein n=1 Tax=mine drainage metagenome TaxID=410659 RepID=E6Q9Q0_9ZZZZ
MAAVASGANADTDILYHDRDNSSPAPSVTVFSERIVVGLLHHTLSMATVYLCFFALYQR